MILCNTILRKKRVPIAGDACMFCVNKAMELMGSYGYAYDYHVEKYMSDRPRRLINGVKATIDAGRNGIPDGAIEVEREQFERKKSVPQV